MANVVIFILQPLNIPVVNLTLVTNPMQNYFGNTFRTYIILHNGFGSNIFSARYVDFFYHHARWISCLGWFFVTFSARGRVRGGTNIGLIWTEWWGKFGVVVPQVSEREWSNGGIVLEKCVGEIYCIWVLDTCWGKERKSLLMYLQRNVCICSHL